jgi:hypothetical protein
MIEALFFLAIAALSIIMAIVLFQTARNAYTGNKASVDFFLLRDAVRTVWARESGYGSSGDRLDSILAQTKIAPAYLIGSTGRSLINSFGGQVRINALEPGEVWSGSTVNSSSFLIFSYGIPSIQCIPLLSRLTAESSGYVIVVSNSSDNGNSASIRPPYPSLSLLSSSGSICDPTSRTVDLRIAVRFD